MGKRYIKGESFIYLKPQKVINNKNAQRPLKGELCEGEKMNEETKKQLEELQEQLEEAEQELKDLEDGNKEADYDEWLDEINEPYTIGCCSFYASEVLSKIDPIAYSCGYADFVDSERDSYEERINDLKSDIEELKDQWLKEIKTNPNIEVL